MSDISKDEVAKIVEGATALGISAAMTAVSAHLPPVFAPAMAPLLKMALEAAGKAVDVEVEKLVDQALEKLGLQTA